MKTADETQRRAPDRTGARQSIWIRLGASAGIVGPLLFTVTFLAQQLLRRDDNPVAEPVSALEAGPYGWVQQVNFVLFAVLVLAFAAGLHHGLAPSRRGVLGPVLLALAGFGLLGAAAFPLREDAAGAPYDPGGHVVAGTTFFVSSALATLFLSRRMAQDPRWRAIAAYALLVGLVAMAGALAMRTLVIPDSAPLHDYAGLVQRFLVVVVIFPCWVLMGLRLLRLSAR